MALPAMMVSVQHRTKGTVQHLSAVVSQDPGTAALKITIGGTLVRVYMPQDLVGVSFS